MEFAKVAIEAVKKARDVKNTIDNITTDKNETFSSGLVKNKCLNEVKDFLGSKENKTEKSDKKEKNDSLENIIDTTNKEVNPKVSTLEQMLEKFLESKENTENKSGINEENECNKQDGLTSEEINQKQIESIKDAFKRIADGEKLTDAEKGNLGEMLMDQYYISQGYEPIHSPRVTDLEHKAPQGIDGVYEKTNLDGTKSYVIADAKVNQSQLSKGLADGTNQMSDEWIDKRLDNAVGKEKADEIRDSYEDDPSSVSREVYHYSYGDAEDGSSKADIFTVDEDGNSNRDKEVVQVFDSDGNVIENRGRGETNA